MLLVVAYFFVVLACTHAVLCCHLVFALITLSGLVVFALITLIGLVVRVHTTVSPPPGALPLAAILATGGQG